MLQCSLKKKKRRIFLSFSVPNEPNSFSLFLIVLSLTLTVNTLTEANCRVWDEVALGLLQFAWSIFGMIWGDSHYKKDCGIVRIHVWIFQTSKLRWLHLINGLHHPLINCIWLAEIGCYLPFYSESSLTMFFVHTA